MKDSHAKCLSIISLKFEHTVNLFIFTAINFHVLPLVCQFPVINNYIYLACLTSYNRSIKGQGSQSPKIVPVNSQIIQIVFKPYLWLF